MNTITDFIKILELKRYSRQTINNYKSHLYLAKNHFNPKPLKTVSDQELFEFIYHLVHTKKFRPPTNGNL